MFSNSLKLIKNVEERAMIIKQLTKLENRIIALTNDLYEEEYQELASRECGLLEEEKNRITLLIDLINQRLSYIEKRCNDHYQLTGESIDAPLVMGVDTLDELEEKVRIIDKYSKNIKLEKELKEDIKSLSSKISLANEKIDINNSLNIELEAAFKNKLSNAFEKLKMYDILDLRDDIEYAYRETEKSLNLAKSNLEIARLNNPELVLECEEMLQDITDDYTNYKDKISTMELIEVFNTDVSDYEELLEKRKKINEIIKYIKNQSFLNMVMDMITNQYNTIMMEQQDVNTFNDLLLEKERKLEVLTEIEEENNSDEFQSVLKVLIENERKKQERILDEQRRIEAEEKKKRLEFERRKQEEILKRQKIIESARKKEMEKRTKQMLEEQQKSVLQSKKQEEDVSFETIKDISDNEEELNVSSVTEEINKEDTGKFRLDLSNLEEIKVEEPVEKPIEEPVILKDKIDIEKELFDEFKNNQTVSKEETSDDIFTKLDEKLNDNKLPSISIDEYMKSFDETKVEDTTNLFDEEEFPSIPM